ncbi:MAG: 16S rRNA (adenine(1518)-N(6)/adenine(1519)-N(6))-dimethyltransferase RsmA [Gemmataceae bacterium]|nr:16S rRNA (adenine(1518)-N(6)/adenine(1519)-N(6))-dimethyltransferase RsmA [Gemmataceae bacterium]
MSQPDLPSPRQTQSFLRTLFQEHGLHPKNKLGQNFLIDLNLLEFIVREGEVTKDDLCLEVGTGTGSLTAKLSDAAKAVVSVEIDHHFHEVNTRGLGRLPNITLIFGDVLKNKNLLNPTVTNQLRLTLEKVQPKNLKLVANLPYAVATPVISNFLMSEFAFERMVVTVQWEIAERLTAKPNTKEYSSLAVLVQSLADVEILRRLSPAVFWPKPKVDSAIVRIRPNAAKRAMVNEPLMFRVFLRDLYAHRRKNLRGAMLAAAGRDHEKAEIDQLIGELGMDGLGRAETLDIPQHLKLFEAFRKRGLLSADKRDDSADDDALPAV